MILQPIYHGLAKRLMLENNRAFTLVEIIVVISLIGTMLFFAIPRMQGSLLSDDSREISKWLILNIADLKNKSVQTQQKFILYVDMDGNHFRIEDESGNAEDGIDLPPGFQVTSVMFSKDKRITNGIAEIRFFPEGYSDRAIIYLTDRQSRSKSYFVEAFLLRVKIHDDHFTF